jgi:hypothetical protein
MNPVNFLLISVLINLSSYAASNEDKFSCIKKPTQKVETKIEQILNAKESVNAAACCSWSLDPSKPIPGCMTGC